MSVASTTDIAGLVSPAATHPPREMAPRTRAMLEGPIVPVLLRLAAPNFTVMATQIVVGVVETYFVGWLGADALAVDAQCQFGVIPVRHLVSVRLSYAVCGLNPRGAAIAAIEETAARTVPFSPRESAEVRRFPFSRGDTPAASR